jgi:hypothetical protein
MLKNEVQENFLVAPSQALDAKSLLLESLHEVSTLLPVLTHKELPSFCRDRRAMMAERNSNRRR